MRHAWHPLTERHPTATGAILATLLAIALAWWLANGAGHAWAAQVKCGDTITTDTTLHKDLVNCPNNGILIGADDVSLNLNGHTIDGNGTRDANCDPSTDFCDFGVAYEHHKGVTVKHGSVRDFEGDILVFRAHRARLLGVSTSRAHFGNIGVANSARILVRNCSGDRSTSREGNGLGLFDTNRVRVLHSSFRNNAHVGIKPVGARNTLIKGNLMAHNGDEGFLMEGGEGFRVQGNRLVRNGAGTTLGPGSHNVIKRNHVLGGRDGIRIEKGHRNLVAHNLVVQTHHVGIRLGIKHPFLGGAHNVVRRNRVRDSRVDGFVVVKKDRHSLLKRNVATRSGDDGFDIESDSTTLTRNRALRNGGLGIQAVPGVNDGGGNRAHGNGNPLQCVNIVCG